jgi:tRNA-dihydrouridine synthase B
MSRNIFYLAPLRGVTDHIFRNAFETHFGRFDYLLTPFIPTVKGIVVNPSHIKDIALEHNDPERIIPQIIGNNPDDIIMLARHLYSMGYSSVNLNMGCPHPQITRKKRGSGMLPYPDFIDSVLSGIFSSITQPFSVKIRLGLESSDEFNGVIPVLNNYAIHEITIHPRTGIQMYDGTVDLDAFDKYYRCLKHTICYNGDIWSKQHFDEYRLRFQTINRWMLGRGVVQDPFMLEELRSGVSIRRDLLAVRSFHDEIFNRSRERLCGPAHLLGKMKELWAYIANLFDDPHKVLKSVQKQSTVDGYVATVDRIFG